MKRAFTLLLLLFSAATVVRVVVGEIVSPSGNGGSVQAVRIPAEGRALAAYYFIVGKVRCSTCLTMEAYSRAAVKERLGKEAQAGKVLFAVVDTEQPRFHHYKIEFKLPSTSLVLAEYVNGKVKRFKNLNRIWRLTRDKKAFLDYVEKEARPLLEDRK